MRKKIDYYDLSIGPFCKKDCIFCSEGGFGMRKYMNFNDFSKFINLNDISTLIITGGEPLLNPDLVNYISLAKNKGAYVGLVTSGDEILEKEYAIKLLNAGLDEIMFSLEGPEEIHDRIVKYKGAFMLLMKSLHTFSILKRKYNFKLIVNTNINKINYKVLPIFIDKILSNFDIDIYHLQWLQYEGKAVKNFNKLFDTYENLLSSFFKNKEKILKHKKKIKFGRVPYCVLIPEFYNMHTNTNYEISTNCGDGNYYDKKIISDKCRSCSKFSDCEYFFKYYIDKFGDSEIKPIKGIKITDIYKKYNISKLGVDFDLFYKLVKICNYNRTTFSSGEKVYLYRDFVDLSENKLSFRLSNLIKKYCTVKYNFKTINEVKQLISLVSSTRDEPFLFYNKKNDKLFSIEFAYNFNILGLVHFNLVNKYRLVHYNREIPVSEKILNFKLTDIIEKHKDLLLSDKEFYYKLNNKIDYIDSQYFIGNVNNFVLVNFPLLLTIAYKYYTTKKYKYYDLFFHEFENRLGIDYEDEHIHLFYLMLKDSDSFNDYSISFLENLNNKFFIS